jgi:hypothetical protein
VHPVKTLRSPKKNPAQRDPQDSETPVPVPALVLTDPETRKLRIKQDPTQDPQAPVQNPDQKLRTPERNPEQETPTPDRDPGQSSGTEGQENRRPPPGIFIRGI